MIENIPSKSNRAFWLNITVRNYTGILGVHNITLRINCPNCLEQNELIDKNISICILNDSSTDSITKACGYGLN